MYQYDAAHAAALHKALHRIRNSLHGRTARLLAAPDEAFVRDLPALVAEVEAGFRQEESLLAVGAPASLRERLADNAVILCALHRVASRVEEGDVALGRRVVAALHELVGLHRPGLCLPVAQARPAPLRHASAGRRRRAGACLGRSASERKTP